MSLLNMTKQIFRTGTLPTTSLIKSFYHEKVLDHYQNPRNVGKLDPNNPNVGTGLVGAPACGDVMKLQV
jgi:NifU-like protein involved in Fe-S cluster formation